VPHPRIGLPVAVALLFTAIVPAPLRPGTPGPGAKPVYGLDVAPDAPELRRVPALRARLRSTPHAYFRFVNCRFAALVCPRFEDVVLPAVTLHGDAHLEQYAVTDIGRGLDDFDDSSTGQAMLDLVRFGASIRLAARERGWEGDADRLWSRFWNGYELALRDPRTEAPEPRFVRRLRAGFSRDRLALLAQAEAFIESLPEPPPLLKEPTRTETIALLARNSGLPVSFFRVKKAGVLHLGIGSAAEEKYLFRVDGETTADDDDVILEFKAVRDLRAIPCIRVDPGPTRIVVGQSDLAYQPYRYAGAVHAAGLDFWVHAWPVNYAELRIEKLRSPDELSEVVYDAGVQLGRGHPKRWSESEAERLRRQLVQGLPKDRINEAAIELAAETVKAWERFRAVTSP